jgi:hypothetical protein
MNRNVRVTVYVAVVVIPVITNYRKYILYANELQSSLAESASFLNPDVNLRLRGCA